MPLDVLLCQGELCTWQMLLPDRQMLLPDRQMLLSDRQMLLPDRQQLKGTPPSTGLQCRQCEGQPLTSHSALCAQHSELSRHRRTAWSPLWRSSGKWQMCLHMELRTCCPLQGRAGQGRAGQGRAGQVHAHSCADDTCTTASATPAELIT